jgi:molybdopterin synthase catalytic subunit
MSETLDFEPPNLEAIDIPVDTPVDITILSEPFSRIDLYQRFDALTANEGRAGAVVTFMGQVRESGDRQHVTGLV